MVIPDLSAPEIKKKVNAPAVVPLAPVADRMLALFLDFLILSPIISLMIAGLIRQVKTYFLLNELSEEGAIAVLLVIFAVIFLTTLIQAGFFYFLQGTPRQFFLQMRVISFPHAQDRLAVNQCLLRAFLWCVGFVFLAIPYLEVLSHPLRRSFHERASDTVVITLKKNYDEGPWPLEARFVSSWLRMSFLLLLFGGVLVFFKTYHTLLAGGYKEKGNSNPYVCNELKDMDVVGSSRLDLAMVLFLLNEISPECLSLESDASLWGDPVNSQELAYLAKYLVSESGDEKDYLDKVCVDSASTVCVLAKYLNEDGDLTDIEPMSSSLWIARFLFSEEKYLKQDYVGSLKLIEELQKEPALRKSMEKRYIRSIWALNESQSRLDQGRLPASVSGADFWIETFKDRYEVP